MSECVTTAERGSANYSNNARQVSRIIMFINKKDTELHHSFILFLREFSLKPNLPAMTENNLLLW